MGKRGEDLGLPPASVTWERGEGGWEPSPLLTSPSNLLAGPRSGLGSEVTLMASGKTVKWLKSYSKGLNAVSHKGRCQVLEKGGRRDSLGKADTVSWQNDDWICSCNNDQTGPQWESLVACWGQSLWPLTPVQLNTGCHCRTWDQLCHYHLNDLDRGEAPPHPFPPTLISTQFWITFLPPFLRIPSDFSSLVCSVGQLNGIVLYQNQFCCLSHPL